METGSLIRMPKMEKWEASGGTDEVGNIFENSV